MESAHHGRLQHFARIWRIPSMDLNENHQRTPYSCLKDGACHHHWRSIDAPVVATILTWI